MYLLDIRTILFDYIITDVICLLVMTVLWRQSRNRFSGMGYFVIDYGLQIAGISLILLRNSVPDVISVSLSNTINLAAVFAGLVGISRFLQKRIPVLPNLFLLLGSFPVFWYFGSFNPDLSARVITLSAVFIVFASECVWLIFVKSDVYLRRSVMPVGLIFAILIAVNTGRIVSEIYAPRHVIDFFSTGEGTAALLVFFQIIIILLTFALSLAVTARLNERLTIQEEKFSKAFMMSPWAVMLTRLSDGLIMDVNDGFCVMTGYARGDVIGRTTRDLHLWMSLNRRSGVMRRLLNGDRIQAEEIDFVNRSGTPFTGLYYADVIVINGEKVVISSIYDITKRKENEEMLRASINENKLLLSELQHRVKNSFSMILGMVNIAARSYEDEGGRGVLEMLSSRIFAVSQLYELLYANRTVSEVDLSEYFGKLIESVVKVSDGIAVRISFESMMINTRTAIPLGIILTELATNAVKYAFPDKRSGVIEAIFRKMDGDAELRFSDNGIGLPEGFDPALSKSLGLTLVTRLTAQVGGTCEYTGNNGTTWTIRFPLRGDI